MANWFDRIKKYYDAGLWTKKMVGNAVVKEEHAPPSSTRKSPARTTTSNPPGFLHLR